MKILKPGHYGEKWALETVCTGYGNCGKGCQATLLVEKNDLRWYKGVPGDSWGSRDPAVCFKCPICLSVTDISKKDWPINVQDLTPWTSEWHRSEEDNL